MEGFPDHLQSEPRLQRFLLANGKPGALPQANIDAAPLARCSGSSQLADGRFVAPGQHRKCMMNY